MLMTYLSGGRRVDFSINSSAGTSFPKLEMLVSGVNSAPSLSVHLTLAEALELADHLKQMVDWVNSNSTMAWEGSTKDRPEDTMPLNLHPRQDQLLTTAGVTLPPPPDEIIVDGNGHVAKHPRGWEVAETATGWADEEDPVFASDEATRVRLAGEANANHGGEVTDADDQWQNELDLFVDEFVLEPNSIIKLADGKTVHCDILRITDHDTIRMPLAFFYSGKVSKKLQIIIGEVFEQGFRYGASWENAAERETKS
jgi:hypothetical protein